MLAITNDHTDMTGPLFQSIHNVRSESMLAKIRVYDLIDMNEKCMRWPIL